MKSQDRMREIRKKRRAEEKAKQKAVAIPIGTPKVVNFEIEKDFDAKSIVPMFIDFRKKYATKVLQLAASNLAVATAIHSVTTALQQELDVKEAPNLSEAIDSAWDLAASSMLLEMALEASGYTPQEARDFAKEILLQKTTPVAPTPAAAPKKTDVETLVETVREDLARMGMKISKSLPKEPTVPTRKQN